MLKVKIFIDDNLNQFDSYYDTRDITHEGNVVFQPNDKTLNDWIAFKSEVSCHASIVVDIKDEYESISIMPNDYLSLLEEEDDWRSSRDFDLFRLDFLNFIVE